MIRFLLEAKKSKFEDGLNERQLIFGGNSVLAFFGRLARSCPFQVRPDSFAKKRPKWSPICFSQYLNVTFQ
jgi:hypothetical protein